MQPDLPAYPTSFAPRWLALALLPVLAAALFWVNLQMQHLAWFPLDQQDREPLEEAWLWVGSVIGPLLESMLFAYPIARLYGRFSIVVAGLITIPVVLYVVPIFGEEWLNLASLQLGALCIFLPAMANIASRQLSGSRLVIHPSVPTQARTGLADEAPRWLLLAFLPILAIALRVIDDDLQAIVWDIGFMPDARALKRTGLLLGAVISPAMVALLFAYPIARLYERRSAAAAVAISAPTVVYWAATYLMDARLPFVIAAYIIKIISLAILVPFVAPKAYRKLGDTSLAIASVDGASPR